MPQHVPPMEEIERQFLTEFDYTREAANLMEVRENLLHAKDSNGRRWTDRVAIPKAALTLCTKGLLTMERLKGVPMVSGLKKQFGAIAESKGQTLEELQEEQKALIASGQLKRMSLDEDAAQFSS